MCHAKKMTFLMNFFIVWTLKDSLHLPKLAFIIYLKYLSHAKKMTYLRNIMWALKDSHGATIKD